MKLDLSRQDHLLRYIIKYNYIFRSYLKRFVDLSITKGQSKILPNMNLFDQLSRTFKIVFDHQNRNRNTTSKLISKHYELSSFTSKQSKIAVLATYQSGNSWEWNMGEFKKREKIALVSIFVFISIVVFDSYTYSNQTKLDQIKW